MRTSAVPARVDVPTTDQRVVIHGVPWDGFETLLRLKGDAPTPRLAYIGGELELMSPSKHHERIGSLIGDLVLAYGELTGLVVGRYGSWTLRNAPKESGVEPDECFIIGPDQDKEIPDLTIEVVWTRGGLGKLEIYRRLGVAEFWQWREGRIQVHVLQKGRYVLARKSRLLPGLDLELLTSLLDARSNSEALRAFREALSRRRRH